VPWTAPPISSSIPATAVVYGVILLPLLMRFGFVELQQIIQFFKRS
jgi:hypothetical protein